MERFFFNIRNYFRQKYHGRYFSILLQELAQNEPTSFRSILEHIKQDSEWPGWDDVAARICKRELTVTREYKFSKPDQRRRHADLALVDEQIPVLLFEVKEYDGNNPYNPAQLTDYLTWVSDKTGFVYISRFAPEPDAARRILAKRKTGAPVASIRYHEIYNALKANLKRKPDCPLTRMICDYLEDIGVGTYRVIDLKKEGTYLAFLLTQMLGFPHQQGMGKLHSDLAVSKAPELMRELFGNLEVLGEWARYKNRKLIGTRFARKLAIEPEVSHKKLRRKLRDSGDEVDELPDGIQKYVEAGTISFKASGHIRNSSMPPGVYLIVEIGYWLYMEKNDKRIYPGLYSYFYGSHLDWDKTLSEKNLKRFPDQRSAEAELKGLLRQSLKKALQVAHGPTRTALKQFRIP
jgi:hypothetical protein